MKLNACMSTVQAEARVLLISLLLFALGVQADVVLTEGTNISADAAADGRIAIDLLGSIWIVPADGGDATSLPNASSTARRPRWSPDAKTLVYQSSTARGSGLWLSDLETQQSEPLGDSSYTDTHPDWHPDGTRIVFSSARNGAGFDLWEIDIETRLAWRLTDLAGDETEPAWSGDGRNLAYVHRNDESWSLMLRLHGRPDQALVTSTEPLAAPAWRPDGSLLSYLKKGDDGWSVWMTILARPPLHRQLIGDEDFFLAPVTWLDRQHMVYTANGQLRLRRFDSWTSNTIPFRARVGQANSAVVAALADREIPRIDEPNGRLVIRAERVFDGLDDNYRQQADVIIDAGRISAIEDHAKRGDAILINLGDVTVIPGLIDAYASLPVGADASLGPLLLALGVTTIVAEHPSSAELNATWAGKTMPGPRLLAASRVDDATDTDAPPWLITVNSALNADPTHRADVKHWQQKGVAVLADNWQTGLASGATLLLATGTRPTSPGGRRYQDVQLANDAGEITFLSGLADAATPGVSNIWRSRPAELIAPQPALKRRFDATTNLATAASTVVLGSQPNGMPPGIATHAELHALAASGLSGPQRLKAAGVNSAAALGLGLSLGRIAVGAAADMLLIDGDPLASVDDTLNIVGVVRNGRFYSVSGLIDRTLAARIVE